MYLDFSQYIYEYVQETAAPSSCSKSVQSKSVPVKRRRFVRTIRIYNDNAAKGTSSISLVTFLIQIVLMNSTQRFPRVLTAPGHTVVVLLSASSEICINDDFDYKHDINAHMTGYVIPVFHELSQSKSVFAIIMVLHIPEFNAWSSKMTYCNKALRRSRRLWEEKTWNVSFRSSSTVAILK